MRVEVRFTLEVDTSNPEELKTFSGEAEKMRDVRDFIAGDAAEYSAEYLASNGFPTKIIRVNGLEY